MKTDGCPFPFSNVFNFSFSPSMKTDDCSFPLSLFSDLPFSFSTGFHTTVRCFTRVSFAVSPNNLHLGGDLPGGREKSKWSIPLKRNLVVLFEEEGMWTFDIINLSWDVLGLVDGKRNLMMETPLLVFNHWSCNIWVNDVNRIPFSISGKFLVDDEFTSLGWL